jgi:hypothetical protein
MRSVVDRNVVMQRIPVLSAETSQLLPQLTSSDVLVSAVCSSYCMSHIVQVNIINLTVNANSNVNHIRRNLICTFHAWLSKLLVMRIEFCPC